MSIKTSEGYIGIGLQVAKGSANSTPDVYIKYLEGSFPDEMEVEHLREGGDDELIGISLKNSDKPTFTFKFMARPRIAAYMLAYLLGKDTTTGAGDPYTHTIIRSATNGRAWLTIRRKVTTNVVEELTDCKIEKITIEGESGKAIMFTVEGNALDHTIDTSEDIPAYESGQPFMFYDGCGTFEVDSVGDSTIKSFSAGITVASQEGMQTDCLILADLPDLKVDIDFSATFFAGSETKWKNTVFNGGTAVSEDLYVGNFTADLKYEENAPDDRGLKLELKDIVYEPVVLDLNSEPAIIEETLAGICKKPSSGEMITAIIKNDIATHIYDS